MATEPLVGQGLEVSFEIVQRDSQGRLIYAEQTLVNPTWQLRAYHRWRNRWCHKYRLANAPLGLREGEYNRILRNFWLRNFWR